jgi:predicted lipoprotein
MRRLAKVLVECGATALCLALVVACTVVKLDKNKSAGSQYSAWEKTGKSFQADQYVAAEWDKQVLPAYEKDSIDFGTVLGALQADRKSAVVKYGVKKETGAVIYIFKVRGTAKVIKYDDSSRNGVLRVSMEPSGPGQGATLQVGPVIVGTTIRDSLDFIRFTDIGNRRGRLGMIERFRDDSSPGIDLDRPEFATIKVGQRRRPSPDAQVICQSLCQRIR